ncbi:MAG: hypothetical protein IKE65_08035 [Clostridia bacterium]|nr:hypothetical protein [Clostridia bacterium]
MDKQNILFVGGDKRQIYCAKQLYASGFEVSIIGFEKCADVPEELMVFTNLKIAVILADVVVLPTPLFIRSEVYAPYSENKLKIEDIVANLDSEKRVFAGKIDDSVKSALEKKHVSYFDFLFQEDIVQYNAYLTAEGTVHKLMEMDDACLSRKKVLVIGFGRIAKHIIRILQAYRTGITICARKKSDVTLAKIIGCKAKNIAHMKDLSGYDYIINTVPAKVFKNDLIQAADTPFIDLAGVEYAAQKYYRFSSVPGKYAPKSAGIMQAHFIEQSLSEVDYE